MHSSRHAPTLPTRRRVAHALCCRLQMGPAPAAPGVQLVDVPYATLMSLNSEAVLDRLTRESVAVFWLDRLVGSVTNMTGQAGDVYGRWQKKCQALHYYTLPAAHRERW